jgi:hypothetical protein
LSSQLDPSSAAMRASFTLPGLAGLSARVEDKKHIAAAKQRLLSTDILDGTGSHDPVTVAFPELRM